MGCDYGLRCRSFRVVLPVVVLAVAFVASCTYLENPPAELANTPVSMGGDPEILGPALTKEQALEDFRYLFEKLRNYHPYIELKRRVEGYDWLAREHEFEQMVLDAETNEDFAKAIAHMVFALNNGHTNIASGSMVESYKNTEWRDVAETTTKEKADYWYALSQKPAPGSETNWTPFIAQYIGGEYVVTQVAPDPEISSKVSVGYKVKSINRIPVDEFVASHRGTRYLPFDPEHRKLYYNDRLRFPPPFTWSAAEFVTPQGETISVDMDWASQPWNAYFFFPPVYVTEPNTMNVVRDLLTCVIDWNGTKVGYVYVPSMKSDWD
jgi:hypothetical protein